MRVSRLIGSAVVALALLASTATVASAAPPKNTLGDLAQATAKYHSLARATHDEFSRFTDVNGIACIAMPGMGAMGVHYVNGTRVGDPSIIPTKPEALVYAPDAKGKLHLAAVEYIVVADAWDATHKAKPRLFGHTFNTTTAPNRFGLPRFYSLHVWVWKNNPAGTFAMWNPTVHCDC